MQHVARLPQRAPVRELVLARHGESALQPEAAASTAIPASPARSPRRAGSRRERSARRLRPSVDLVAVDRVRARRARQPTSRSAGGTCRGSSCPSSTTRATASFEGGALDAYREWAGARAARARRRRGEPGARSRRATRAASGAARAAGGDDPARRALAADPLRRSTRPRASRRARRSGSSSTRRPYPLDAGAARARGRRARGWAAAPGLLIARRRLAHVGCCERVEALHPRARADRARRRGHLPRLRRRRLDLPLARRSARSATGSRRSTSTTACAAPSPRRTRASAASASAPRSSRLRGGRPRPSCAELRYSFATEPPPRDRAHRLRPGRDRALPARLERARRRGSRRGARTASSARCSRVWREETEAYCREQASPFRDRLVEPGHEARADPRRRSCRCSSGSTRAPREPARARRRASRGCRARSSAALAELLASGPARRRPTSAAASARCASTTRSGSRERSPGGRGRSSATAPGLEVRTWRPGDRLAGRREEGAGSARGREDARAPSGTRGRSSCAATRSSPSRDWSRHPGGKESCRGRSREHVDLAERALEEGVGRDPHRGGRAPGAHRASSARRSRRLRGPRPAARRRAQGRRLLHGRPHARADDAVRDRLHGDLELRRVAPTPRASSGSSRTSTSTSRAATCSSSRTSSTRA